VREENICIVVAKKRTLGEKKCTNQMMINLWWGRIDGNKNSERISRAWLFRATNHDGN
jgi:hypothetical protein